MSYARHHMMNKAWSVMALGLVLAACTDDGGVEGSGDDRLPKRGEMATDPTVVSAAGYCSTVDGNPSGRPSVNVVVDASDPAGRENLGSCAGTTGTITGQGSFGVSIGCYLVLPQVCTAGEVKVVGLTISNDTGGITTASVSLTLLSPPR